MTTVWVLETGDWDSTEIVGVFSSVESAMTSWKLANPKPRNKFHEWVGPGTDGGYDCSGEYGHYATLRPLEIQP